MFHANAWGMPYGAALAGARPDPARPLPAGGAAREADRSRAADADGLRADDLRRPAALRRRAPEVDLSSLTNAACGGSAVPRQLMQDFEERHGVRIFQALGDDRDEPGRRPTRARASGAHDDAYWDDRAMQGRPLPWVELRLVDDDGDEVPWDGSRPARSRCAGRGSPPRYFERSGARSSTRAGCAPATSRRSTSRPSCGSPTAPRT